MIRDPNGEHLTEALIFQIFFATAICEALKMRFEDNYLMNAFKMLEPTNMSIH